MLRLLQWLVQLMLSSYCRCRCYYRSGCAAMPWSLLNLTMFPLALLLRRFLQLLAQLLALIPMAAVAAVDDALLSLLPSETGVAARASEMDTVTAVYGAVVLL